MQTQTALKNMPLEIIGAWESSSYESCTALALAKMIKGGKRDDSFGRQVNQYMRRFADKVYSNGHFGIENANTKKVYKSFGLKWTSALVNGKRFPKNCILRVINSDHTAAHVEIGSIDPVYGDVVGGMVACKDCHDEFYYGEGTHV